MRRLIYLVVALVAVLLLVAVGVYAIRSRSGRAPAARADAAPSHTMPDTSAGARQPATAAPPGTPRGPITIDPRRQQLIGVKTVAVTHEPMQQSVRTVGVFRYDETRQADINLRVE